MTNSNAENKDLGASLIDTLASSALSEVSQDVAEAAIDSLLMEGFIRDIPIVSTITRLGRTAITFRDYFLIKKVLLFLYGLTEIAEKDRKEFAKKIKVDQKFQQHVGETVIMLLDRFDDLQKPQLMAKLFSAYIKSEINYNDFARLSTAIDRAFMQDLKDLLDYFAGKDIDVRSTKRNLYTSNLANFYVLSEEEQKRDNLEYAQVYHFNQQAQQLAKIILRDNFKEGRW